MKYPTLEEFCASETMITASKGPIAVIFCEDGIEVSSTLRHHNRLGFGTKILLCPKDLELTEEDETLCTPVIHDPDADGSFEQGLNALIEAFTGQWMYYCFNGEYLHFPFCEDRNIKELLAFVTEERRASVFAYVIDLYSNDLEKYENGVSLETAHMDGSGYYAQSRKKNGEIMDRQLDIYGGLKWRFEEFLPELRRRIDRIALFQAQKGLKIDRNHLFNDEEYNTFSCPWHHNTTVALCSFRTAKYLKTNPASTFEVDHFTWSKSVRFHWNSQQLMDLGLMEPGQWF